MHERRVDEFSYFFYLSCKQDKKKKTSRHNIMAWEPWEPYDESYNTNTINLQVKSFCRCIIQPALEYLSPPELVTSDILHQNLAYQRKSAELFPQSASGSSRAAIPISYSTQTFEERERDREIRFVNVWGTLDVPTIFPRSSSILLPILALLRPHQVFHAVLWAFLTSTLTIISHVTHSMTHSMSQVSITDSISYFKVSYYWGPGQCPPQRGRSGLR